MEIDFEISHFKGGVKKNAAKKVGNMMKNKMN